MANLLSWLGNQAQGIIAQVNPWDNGATYNSVVNAPQQQAPQRPIPVAPQMLKPQAQQAWLANNGGQIAPQQPAPQQPAPVIQLGKIPQAPRIWTAAPPQQQAPQPTFVGTKINQIQQGIDQGKSLQNIADSNGLTKNEVIGVQQQYKPGYGGQNPFEALGSFIGDTANNAAGLVSKPITTLLTANDPNAQKAILGAVNQLNNAYQAGAISNDRLNQEVQKLTGNLIGNTVGVNGNGIYQKSAQTAAQDSLLGGLQQGIDTASVLPAGKVVGGVVRGAEGITGNLVKQALITNAKQAGVYGTTSTANDLVQGRGISPESLAANYVAPFVLGAGSEVAGVGASQLFKNVVKPGTQATVQAAKSLDPNNIAMQHPAISALQDHGAMLQQADQQMATRGLSPNNPARIQNAKAQAATLAQINATKKQIMQGGYAQVPGKNPIPNANPKDGTLPISSPEGINSGVKAKVLPLEQLQTGKPSVTSTSKVPKESLNQPQISQIPSEKIPQTVSTHANASEVPLKPENQRVSPQQMPIEKSTRLSRVPDNLVPKVENLKAQQTKYSLHTNNTTKPLDVNSYVKEQSKIQDTARKSTNLSIAQKLKNEVSTKLIDSLSPLEKPLRQFRKSGEITPKNDLTPQLDRALRGDTIAGQYIKDHGLAKIIQNVPDTKVFDQYVIAKHAADLEKNGIKTGRNLAADKQLVEQLKSKYEPHAQELMKYNQGLLDKSVKYGLISKELATSLKKQYPNYVPANRIFGEGEKNVYKGNSAGLASKSTQSVVQRIKGSERAIESPLSSIASKTSDVISQGEKNLAAKTLASYKDLLGNPFSLREMKSTETVGAKSTIAFLDKGKVRRFETTPEIEAAAKSLNKQQMNILQKIVSIPTRALRLGATGINVGFTLANVAKDMASAAINSEHPFRTSAFNPKVAGKAMSAAFNHNSKAYGELVREGAGGTSFDLGRDQPRKNVAQIRAGKSRVSTVEYTITHPAQLLRAVEDTIGRSEELTRAMQYFGNKDAALKNGSSLYEAKIYGANAARHNTVNFARHGEWGVALNSAIPYLNAGIQGSRTFVRNVKERPLQTLAKVGVLSTIPVLTTTAWNLSDPKRKDAYNSISDYEKQGNIIIVPPNPTKDAKTGKWNVIKIPVSQEVANLNNAARSIFEASVNNGKIDPAAIMGDLAGTITSLNVSSPRQIANQVTPQALKPVIEGITNQNLFTGNKIVPDSQKNLPAPDQYGQYTSGTAKGIGNITNTSPRIIDNMIKTMFGGAGQNVVNIADNALSTLGVMPRDQVQGKTLQDSIVGRFYGASAKQPGDAITQSFDTAKQQLIDTPEYKALNQVDKAKALNRLQTDITAIQYNKSDTQNPNPLYPAKNLSANQQAYANGTKSLASYTQSPAKSGTPVSPNLDSQNTATLAKYNALSAADKTKAFQTTNNAEYQYNQAKYANDKANGSITAIQDIVRKTALAKDQIGSNYSKDIRDLYGQSKATIATYVSSQPNGQDIVNQLSSYDQSLKSAGLNTTLKFQTGVTASAKRGRGSSVARSSGMPSYKAALAATQKIRVPKSVKAPSFGKLNTFKMPIAKKYTVAKINIPKYPNVKVRKTIA